MKKTLIPIIILILLLFASCAEEKLEGEIITTFPDGTPMLVYFYRWTGNNKIKVKEVDYYSNKEKRVEKYFNEENKLHGTTTHWHENGKKWLAENYQKGVKHGEFIEWYKSGKKNFRGYYKNGTPDGKWTFWNEKGKKTSSISYKNGQISK